MQSHFPISALNLVPLRKGESEQEAIQNMVQLAQHVEKLGYERYWIAEHHNAPNLVSSATALLIQHTLEHTDSIMVGSGGIMLPNHAPLVVAEQFGTMATMFPNRLNLGLGRAPGTDMMTASALRRDSHKGVYTFGDDIKQLLKYFGPEEDQSYVRPYPGVDTNIPIYVLGSSTDSAHLAARLGLPYVFAAHFAPQQMAQAIEIYRDLFEPSEYLDKPRVTVCLNVIIGETDEEATYLSSTMHLMFLGIVRNSRLPLQPPTDQLENIWSPQEKYMAQDKTNTSFIGSEETVKKQFLAFQEKYKVDEIMAVSYIYDLDKQYKSFESFKKVVDEIYSE
ncbi:MULTISPECIES: LLM class flavin-dependent oxidoreductase [Mammaliicoccus]|uniref:LLM class flavin-dependent oxidoreductase n=1 Tax=Mammaliicoccus TaxID=2803850 RepID=UPI000302584E|nr:MULTISPECIES: LLM class flavin-dependent oxidoreductase [Mammaliicoccus]MCR1872625.1 LLM class flavin-dependent oxidoreductase [Mammaliicoccus lentus]WQL57079.1 LLM class flavin-dependent oxidoreductase [Mammaliicoccus lentus]